MNMILGEKQRGDTVLILRGGHAEWEIHDCWKPSTKNVLLGQPDTEDAITIDAGSVYEEQFTLWSYPKTKKCLPTGEYVFSREYGTDEKESATLNFTLGLESSNL